MKKLLIALLIILLAGGEIIEVPEAGAADVTVIVGAPAGGGSDCPTGTYSFAWNGEHSGNEYNACKADGETVILGTDDGTDRVNATAAEGTGVGFQVTNTAQYLRWAISSAELDVTQGTIWISANFSDIVTNASAIFESIATAGQDQISARVSTSEAGHIYYEGDNNNNNILHGTSASISTWVRLGYTWQPGLGSNEHCIKLCDSAGANCSDSDTWSCEDDLTVMDPQSSVFAIGDYQSSASTSNSFYIDNVYITTGWQSADPKF